MSRSICGFISNKTYLRHGYFPLNLFNNQWLWLVIERQIASWHLSILDSSLKQKIIPCLSRSSLGKMPHFKMDSTSSLVLSTRDIEYHFIILFSAILIFSLIFVIVYRLKNSKIKEYKEY